MAAGSIILGLTLCFFAGWLHWKDTEGWPNESFETVLDKQYRSKRSAGRRRIHYLIAGCGLAILVAAVAGPGVIWLVSWSLVMIGSLVVVLLALVDAFRTHRYHSAKLPEIRRETIGDSEN
ncbi:hypothetical protein OAF09_00585 [bacterium]|nr:hypothetical protein [Rubripirellula sp.]MDB4339084.1 hypothetical protein [Rubripirellula sp.]MDB4676702.1 hypothetical protein [bacterium]